MDCPLCRAGNDAGPQCRRCKADLSLLFAVEEQRRLRLRELYAAIRKDDLRRAAALLDEVEKLRPDDESLRLRAVLALLRGQFALALELGLCTRRSGAE
jgi:hypothetical protein